MRSARADLALEDGRHVSVAVEGHQVTVGSRGGSHSVTLACPAGTDLVIGTASGSVQVAGRAGAVVITTVSGKISIDEALSADLRSMSGSIEAGRVTGQLRAKSASGKAAVDYAGRADVATVSGDVRLPEVAGEVRARSVSGDVVVTCEGKEAVNIHTVSGKVTVSLPGECRPNPRLRSLSGKTRVGIPTGDGCEVAVSSLSGSVELVAKP